MKLLGTLLAVALLACALPAVAQTQQPPARSNAEQDRPSASSAAARQNFTGGRFALDIAGHDAGLVNRIGDKDETPTVADSNARAAVAARPPLATRPGAIIVAPVADDKDDD
ncbi:MAG: hypothetical protein J0L81_16225 [Caulobacterales bacterium]|nr:hypothetical protein [Caulobacterales bacterium]